MITNDQVRDVIEETGVVPDMAALDDTKSLEENGVDSLDTYTVLFALEEKFGVSLEKVDMEKVASVDLMVAYLNAHGATS